MLWTEQVERSGQSSLVADSCNAPINHPDDRAAEQPTRLTTQAVSTGIGRHGRARAPVGCAAGAAAGQFGRAERALVRLQGFTLNLNEAQTGQWPSSSRLPVSHGIR